MVLGQWADLADDAAKKEECSFARSRKEGWHTWLRDMERSSIGAIFKYTKLPPRWRPDSMGRDGPLAGQQAAVDVKDRWYSIWNGSPGVAAMGEDVAKVAGRRLPPLPLLGGGRGVQGGQALQEAHGPGM